MTTVHQVEIPPEMEARFQQRIDELLIDYPGCPREWLHKQLFKSWVVHGHPPEHVTISETD
ncbi:MAG: hypothetical protein AAF529_23290 [Pseudomonadota bacterium]